MQLIHTYTCRRRLLTDDMIFFKFFAWLKFTTSSTKWMYPIIVAGPRRSPKKLKMDGKKLTGLLPDRHLGGFYIAIGVTTIWINSYYLSRHAKMELFPDLITTHYILASFQLCELLFSIQRFGLLQSTSTNINSAQFHWNQSYDWFFLQKSLGSHPI